ncbi:MAG: hypothetical protein MUR46_13140 [Loktanella sp.]|jgi:hypothetical protein|nr:hypothetical protein [Loktanella sp.]MDO7607830.1 hypothetical protein [Loktanella sp.]MDO7622757.1 hypothetical protein [Loktanella sp.]MDO7626344.1 hypothetical protein [Loktanella sp.]MDO7630665.1 hypothetical protein [Loktanella sp.]
MPFFLNPRFAMLLLVAMPLAGGAVVHPHGASAFVMGAWAGTLLVAPPLMIIMWALGLRTIGQLLRPLARLPILIGLTLLMFYLTDTDIGLGGQVMGGGAVLLWLKQGRKTGLI